MTSSQSVSKATIHDDVCLLTLTGAGGRHFLSLGLIKQFSRQLELAKRENVIGLITIHEGNWFSAGFDYSSSEANEAEADLAAALKGLIGQLVELPFPTVACVKGCAYGAGFTLALAHDYLVLSNDTPVSLRQDELPKGHELPHYAAALLRDKFPPSIAWELAALSPYVKPPHYGPMGDYVKPYVGWSEDQVVDELLRPSANRIGKSNGSGSGSGSGRNYSTFRERLLAGVSAVLKSSVAGEPYTKPIYTTNESASTGPNTPPPATS